jgi:hypothetical protein
MHRRRQPHMQCPLFSPEAFICVELSNRGSSRIFPARICRASARVQVFRVATRPRLRGKIQPRAAATHGSGGRVRRRLNGLAAPSSPLKSKCFAPQASSNPPPPTALRRRLARPYDCSLLCAAGFFGP